MVVKAPNFSSIRTLADLHERLGGVPLERILFDPLPGTATESDALSHLNSEEKRLVELIDGVLVEKPMGQTEARLALFLGAKLIDFCDEYDLAWVSGPDAPSKMHAGNLRLPDISVFPWEMFPNGEMPEEPIASVCPWLGIEVLSESNTKAEIASKLREYFASGMKQAWIIDPKTRSAKIHTSPKKFRVLEESDFLEGGDLVPGFRCSLRSIFQRGGRKRQRPK